MLCATGSPNRQIRRVAPLMSCVMVASLSSNDGRQGGTAAVCRRRADGWIRIPARKRIYPCLDSIIALLYCCIQAIADNYSPKGLLANSLIAAWDAGVAFDIFFRHCKGVLCLTFSRASKKRAAWCPLGAVKACAAWRSSERKRNAGRTPHQQMLDAVRRRLSNPYLL